MINHLGSVCTILACFFGIVIIVLWNGLKSILKVFDICFRSSEAMSSLTTFRFFKPCNTSQKTDANGGLCQKNSVTGTAFTARFRYWSAAGVFDRIATYFMLQAIVIKGVTAFSLDSTHVKVHPNGTGAPKRHGPQSIGGWTTKIH